MGQRIVVKVETEELSAKQFADDLSKKLSKYDALTAKDPKNVERVKGSIVNDFVMSAILKNWAVKNNIIVSKEQIDNATKEVRAGFPDDFSFREELSKQGLSISEWQKGIEVRVLEKAVLSSMQKKIIEPTDKEVFSEFEIQKLKFRHSDRIYLQQIVVATKTDADRIQAALKQKKSFAELAKQFSITPEGKNGGVLGWMEKGTLEVFDSVLGLPLGQISETIQSPYGFHIILVLKKELAGMTPFSEVQKTIKKELQAKAEQRFFSAWLDSEIRRLHVFKDQDTIDKLNVETIK